MTDNQNPDQNAGDGVVHDVIDVLEAPPEPPPKGPVVWAKDNLFSGATPFARFLNGALTVFFALAALYTLQFITGFFFSEERRWSAVTQNMKLLMVQAYPRDDLERIWITLGIFMVLVAWSLVAFKSGGEVSVYSIGTSMRAAGVVMLIVTILHASSGADTIGLPLLPDLDMPSGWSGGRFFIFVVALGLAPLGYVILNRFGEQAKERMVPFLGVFPIGMALVHAFMKFVDLPFPNGQYTEAPMPIASTTSTPWGILFVLTIVMYFVGKMLDGALGDRFRRLVILLWIVSYPIIIMIIQRNPILIWDDILSLSLDAPLGALLLSLIVGGAIVWWLAAPNTGEEVRIVGFVLVIATAFTFVFDMAFLLRGLAMAFALTAVAAPSFGGTRPAQKRMVRTWSIIAFVVVLAFVLGEADTSLQFQGTTFIGGFNLTILLAIAGLTLSFPLGLILGLARRSTMPIFRLLATGYIEIVRSVPLITWLYFGTVMLSVFLPQGVEFDEIVLVVGAIAIFNAAYVAEQIRGGLQSINKGQYEAARAMGLTTVQSMSLIILPQAIRAVIPSLVGSIIVSFKDTSLVAIIGLFDFLLIIKQVVPGQSNPNFQGLTFQMLFFAAIFYWVITFTFSRMALRYEKKVGLGQR